MPISRILAAGAATVATAASLAFVAPVVAGGKGEAVGQKYPTTQSTTHICENDSDHTISFAGPDVLWPPNHKYFSAVIAARSADSDDTVVLESAGTHDEYADPAAHTGEQNGAGNTGDDVSPAAASDGPKAVASVTQSIRSERSGNGDGRVYTFTVQAEYSDGDVCQATFTSRVPHDMRPSNRT